MEVERSVIIAKPIAEVFAFVADPANDSQWCPKLISVKQVEGDGPGPDGRWCVVHRPVPLRPPRTMDYRCLAWDPPHRIEWREDDGSDVLRVTYTLAEQDGGTRFSQHDDVQLGAPRLLHPLMRVGIGHDVGGQLRRLKQLLERA
jgi:uncharacterized protein YndB with AHSA1/START domain